MWNTAVPVMQKWLINEPVHMFMYIELCFIEWISIISYTQMDTAKNIFAIKTYCMLKYYKYI